MASGGVGKILISPELQKAIKNPSWFKDGLKFSCTGCGKCCTGTAGFVWITKQDVVKISQRLQIGKDEFLKNYARWIPRRDMWTLTDRWNDQNLDCIFLDGKQCKIYDIRPQQCRTYPFWPSVVDSPSNWKEEKKDCEGIEHETSKLVPFDDIITEAQRTIDIIEECKKMGPNPSFDNMMEESKQNEKKI